MSPISGKSENGNDFARRTKRPHVGIRVRLNELIVEKIKWCHRFATVLTGFDVFAIGLRHSITAVAAPNMRERFGRQLFFLLPR